MGGTWGLGGIGVSVGTGEWGEVLNEKIKGHLFPVPSNGQVTGNKERKQLQIYQRTFPNQKNPCFGQKKVHQKTEITFKFSWKILHKLIGPRKKL